MLREEMEKYTKLTGEDATHVPIIKLGAYLDGYEKGMEMLDKIRVEIEERRHLHQLNEVSIDHSSANVVQALTWVLEIIDKYKTESEEINGR